MTIHSALMNFEGYGGRAGCIFIGIEERNPADSAANLTAREGFASRMDLKVACKRLFGSAWWGSRDQIMQPVWVTASKLVHAIGGYQSWTHVRDSVLGRAGSRTLLSELLPIPLDASNTWPVGYKHRFEFSDYPTYASAMAGTKARPGPRLSMLRRIICEERPDFVFCYGSSKLGYFKRLFPNLRERDWQAGNSHPKGYSAQKFHTARMGGMRIAVTRHYSLARPRAFGEADIPNLLKALK